MRVEYEYTIRQLINQANDKAKEHGRKIKCVWLTEDEWDEFIKCGPEYGTGMHHTIEPLPMQRGLWDGVPICVCPDITG